ncbi:MAG: 4Fe-4S cluster-binding domain-containing protein, partial [Candidatus Amulumruptor sp.]|nr:4Fe-4S cluster-binding domain-containing protein [Candidatus Amulumruptor sp.]
MIILDIIEATTVDGPGFRTAVYFAGCAHRCPGCHNPQSWDFEGGAEVSVEALADRLLEAGLDVTLSGGDPAYQAAEAALLARAVRSAGHTVWLYTG